MIHRGIASFGLDTGHCPPWLYERMVKLGREMVYVLIAEYGPDECGENQRPEPQRSGRNQCADGEDDRISGHERAHHRQRFGQRYHQDQSVRDVLMRAREGHDGTGDCPEHGDSTQERAARCMRRDYFMRRTLMRILPDAP